jgi:hypothetical protein
MWKTIFETMGVPFAAGVVLTFLAAATDKERLNWGKANEMALNLVILGAGSLAGIFNNDAVAAGLARHDAGNPLDWAIGILMADFAVLSFLIYTRKWWTRPSRSRGVTQLIFGVSTNIMSIVVIVVGYN